LNKKILIIEDDKEMCIELSEVLINFDYKIQSAYDGFAGKKLIEKNKYDIILLDLKLPGFDGYQILEFISKKKIESKIIVMTAKMKILFKDLINEKEKKKKMKTC
jgi:DNA-binding response OmpR family regulator